MHAIANRLQDIINQHLPALNEIPETEFSAKPLPEKWSKKEILGHLVDSAQNNLRRFIVAQYEDKPTIVYQQDTWVNLINYQDWEKSAIIDLWHLLNKQICEVLRNTPGENALRKCQTQDLHTIEWLASDYVKHLLHHLSQITRITQI